MIVKLTPDFIANNLVCPEGKRRIEYVDKGGTGLYVEVRATSQGQGTYYWRTRNPEAGNRTTHHKLGLTTEIDLETAREQVRQLRAKQTLGLNVDTRNKPNNKEIPSLTEFMEETYIPFKRDSGKLGWARDRDLFRNHLKPIFGDKKLNAISTQSIALYLSSLRSRGYAASTCNHPVKVLRHALRLAHQWQIIDSNSAAHVKLLRENNTVNNLLTDTELSCLLTVLGMSENKMVSSLCLYLISTGARLQEARLAQWSHVNIKDHIWTIPVSHSKSGRIRSIPLNQSAIDVLNKLGTKGKYEHLFVNLKTGKPYTTIHKAWNRLRIKADLPHLRIHDLRHQYASFLVNSGRTLYEVQQILGHSDPSVTQRYAHLSTKSLQAAADSASDIINAAMPK